MNDTNGTTVVDTKGNNGTGTYTPADGHVGTGAISLDGESDYINLPSNSISSPFSISMWVKSDKNVLNPYMFMIDSQTPRCLIGMAEGHNDLGMYTSSSGWHWSGQVIQDDEWHHIVGIWDGSTKKLYIDNQLYINESDSTTSWGGAVTRIGLGYDDGAPWQGGIDDVRIYSRVLEESEILELAAGTEAE
jgi:hypothetical protein